MSHPAPLAVIPACIPASAPGPGAKGIPRVVFQTFKTSIVTAAMWQAARSWSELNPDFEYRFFDDEGCRAFLEEHFGSRARQAFDALPAGAFRADLWRYCALAVHGGVYADIDAVCRRPLRRLIRAGDEFVVARGERPWFLFNAFMCCAPRHPVLLGLIERAIPLVLKGDGGRSFEIVGPAALGAAVNTLIGRPERAPIAIGRQQGNGYSFRILRKMAWPVSWRRPGRAFDVFRSRILDGVHTVLWCKYDGYGADLQALGVDHWLTASPNPIGQTRPPPAWGRGPGPDER